MFVHLGDQLGDQLLWSNFTFFAFVYYPLTGEPSEEQITQMRNKALVVVG